MFSIEQLDPGRRKHKWQSLQAFNGESDKHNLILKCGKRRGGKARTDKRKISLTCGTVANKHENHGTAIRDWSCLRERRERLRADLVPQPVSFGNLLLEDTLPCRPRAWIYKYLRRINTQVSSRQSNTTYPCPTTACWKSVSGIHCRRFRIWRPEYGVG